MCYDQYHLINTTLIFSEINNTFKNNNLITLIDDFLV